MMAGVMTKQIISLIRPVDTRHNWILWFSVFLLSAGAVRGFELWSTDTGYLDLRISSKWTSLLAHTPDDSILYPEKWNAANLWRVRADLTGRPHQFIAVGIAYEQRMRFVSENSGNGVGGGDQFSNAPIPFRIRSGDESIVRIGDSFEYRHELDRAYLVADIGSTECTIGRQSFGMGRGTVFSAVDIFVPFAPVDYDREWRRGIDALRVNIPISNSFSTDLVTALGSDMDSSAACVRVKGFFGGLDGEFIVARRYKDTMAAIATSVPVLDAEIHGEIALFNTSDDLLDNGLLKDEQLAVKALIGGSYTLDFGAGVMASAEYLYSDFGIKEITDLPGYFEDDVFLSRLQRGDLQVLGRHTGMSRISYGFGTEKPITMTWIFSATDGSGLLMPSVNWSFSDEISITAFAYLSYGSDPEEGNLTSQYGDTPTTGLLQLSFYL